MAKIEPGDGDPRHGSYNGYSNCGCHCPECTEANRLRWHEYTAADPSRLAAHAERERRRRGGPPRLKPSGLTTLDVAERAGCDHSWVSRQRLAGRIVGRLINHRWYYDEAEVERWLAGRAGRGRPRTAQPT